MIQAEGLPALLPKEQHLKLGFLLEVIFKHLAGHTADSGTYLLVLAATARGPPG